jgi:hypothetical protein
MIRTKEGRNRVRETWFSTNYRLRSRFAMLLALEGDVASIENRLTQAASNEKRGPKDMRVINRN